MLRRCSRLHRSQVQTSRPFSVPRAQLTDAWATSVATAPQVAQVGGWVGGPEPSCGVGAAGTVTSPLPSPWRRPWLRSVATHVNDVRRPEFLVGMKLNLPPSYLLIHRVWLGGIGVLCQLGGTVPAREVVVEHLPGMRLRHLPPAVG